MWRTAIKDLFESIKLWRLWFYMAWFEVRISYRGSILGPFWITFAMAVFVGAISVVYSRLFHQDAAQYLPFLLCGFLNWYLISNTVIQSCRLYIDSANFVTQIKLPFFIYVLKLVTKESIIYSHNFLVYIALIIIIRMNPGWTVLLAIPGLILVILNLVWVATFLAMLSARFRDIPPIVGSLVQVCFFISPITWMPKLIGSDSIILKLNPISYLLDVVRDPLLGILPPWYSWAVVVGMLLVGGSLLLLFFARYGKRIPFWVL